MEHNKSSPVVRQVNKYAERNVSLRCLFSMGKARAGQGLFVRHYQINAAEGAQRGALEERSYTEGRPNSSFRPSSRQKVTLFLKPIFDLLLTFKIPHSSQSHQSVSGFKAVQ